MLQGLAAGAAAGLLAPRPAGAADLVKLGMPSFPGPSIGSHSKTLIKQNGFDTRHGWELEWFIRPTSEAYYNDLVTGVYHSIDLGGLNVYANLFNKGVPITVVQACVRWPFPVVVRADSGIKTIADLKGKRLGIDRSSYVYAYCSIIAKSQGFDLEKDVQLTNVGLFQALPRLQRGDFDAATLLFEPALLMVHDQPRDFRILFDASAEFARAIGAGEGVQFQAFRTDWIERNPGGIAKVVASYRDLSQYLVDQPAAAVKQLAVPSDKGGANLSEVVGTMEYVTGSPEGLKTAWVSQPASELKDRIKRELDAYLSVGLIEKIPGEGFIYAGQ